MLNIYNKIYINYVSLLSRVKGYLLRVVFIEHFKLLKRF